MSYSNNVYPNSRAEDERIVKRNMSSFRTGMMPDVDIMSAPNGSLFDLNNMRVNTSGISGRPGSYKYANVKLPYDIDDYAGTINGKVVTLTTNNDFTIKPKHIGYKIVITKSSVDYVGVITACSADNVCTVAFQDDFVEFVGVTNVTISIRGPINASIVDQSIMMSYYLIGTRLYSFNLDTNEWQEYFCINTTVPHSSASTFQIVNRRVVLSNRAGLFVLNTDIDTNFYFWKANTALPQRRIDAGNANITAFSNPSTYKYLYGYTRIKNAYNSGRFESSNMIEQEVPPFYNDGTDVSSSNVTPVYIADKSEYGGVVINHENPTMDVEVHDLSINCASLTIVSKWRDFSNSGTDSPCIGIKFNNVGYVAYFNFKQVRSMEDIQNELQTGIASYVSSNIVVRRNNNKFSLYSENETDIIAFDTVYSISSVSHSNDLLYSDFEPSEPALEYVGSTRYSNSVKYLRADSDARFTHYSLYRTADIFPVVNKANRRLDDPRLQNGADLYGLVEDVQVCKLSKCVLVYDTETQTGVLTYDSGSRFTAMDQGNTVSFYLSGVLKTVVLSTYNYSDSTFTVTGGEEDVSGTAWFFFGASDIVKITSFVDGLITFDSNYYDLTSSDISKILYLDDGSYTYVKSIESSVTATVTNEISTTVEYALINPTYRVFNDTVSDVVLTGRMSVYPMNMAYFGPVGNSSIGAYSNGIYMSIIRGGTNLEYSQANDIARIGYHNTAYQINNKINSGITAILPATDGFNISTETDTYFMTTQQSIPGGNAELGEYYTILPDPYVIVYGIGLSHQTANTKGTDRGLLVYTTEPAIRFFDGTQYGEDITLGLINRSIIQRIDGTIILAFDHGSGASFWGNI